MKRIVINLLKKILTCLESAHPSNITSALPQLEDLNDVRRNIAENYIKGNGIEIGALTHPVEIPKTSKVKYVDRITTEEQRIHYPECKDFKLVDVDIIDDGERLSAFSDNHLDFVILNGVLEHYENPFLALKNVFRVLKPGGILFMHVPDKEYTFDKVRPVTTLEHLLADYQGKPLCARRDHFEEWSSMLDPYHHSQDNVDRLMELNYSIHFHVWTQTEILEILVAMKRHLSLSFKIELVYPYYYGPIIILRKAAS